MEENEERKEQDSVEEPVMGDQGDGTSNADSGSSEGAEGDSVAVNSDAVKELLELLEVADSDEDKAGVLKELAEAYEAEGGGEGGADARAEALDTWREYLDLRPDDTGVYARAAGLAEELGQHEVLEAVLSDEIGVLPQGEARLRSLYRLADLRARELNDPQGAKDALMSLFAEPAVEEAVYVLGEDVVAQLSESEERGRLLDAMRGTAEQSGEWRRYASLTERALDDAEAAERRTSLFMQLAQVRAQALRDVEGAMALLLKAALERPGVEGVHHTVLEVAANTGAWEAAVAVFRQLFDAAQDEEHKKAFGRILGDIYTEQLNDEDKAAEYYQVAYQGAVPESATAIEMLEERARESNDSDRLVELLDAKLQHAETDGERDKARLELGVLLSGGMGEHDAALKYLQQVRPNSARREAALHHIISFSEDAELKEKCLSELIALGKKNPHLLEDYVRLGELRVEIGKGQEALDVYRQALMKDRQNPAVIAGLEALAEADPSLRETLAQLLGPVYTSSQNYEALARMTELRLEAAEEPGERKTLYRRLGDLFENRLGDRRRAFEVARKAFSEDLSDMGMRMWLEKVGASPELYPELAVVYVEEAQNVEQEAAVGFLHRAASIYAERLDDPAGASSMYEEILARVPGDEKALNGLDEMYRSGEDFSGLAKVLRARAEQARGPERRRQYLNELGQVLGQSMKDYEGAVAVYREVLELSPDDIDAFDALEGLLAELGSFDELAALYTSEEGRLSQQRHRESAPRRASLLSKLGSLRDERQGDVAGAVQAFKQALEADEEHPRTLQAMRERAGQGEELFLEALDDRYMARKEWKFAADNIGVWLAAESDPAERRALLLRQAHLYRDELDAPDMAFEAVARAYDDDRSDADLVDELYEVAERGSMWQEFVGVVGADVEAIPSPELRQLILKRLGNVVGEKLGNFDGAVDLLRKALQYDPKDVEALEALDGLYSHHERWLDLAKLLERRLDLVDEPTDKSAILERLATVWSERLKEPEAALRCHQQIMELDPEHPLALREMERLYREMEDWPKLAANLTAQAKRAEELDERLRVHRQLAEIYTEELDDTEAAIRHWEEVLSLLPGSSDALEQLDVLYALEDRWEELAELLRVKLAHTDNKQTKVEITQRIGVILQERLGRDADALEAWETVLADDPKNLEALRTLSSIYKERASWDALVKVLETLLPLGKPEEAKAIRLELADAYGRHLEDKDTAIRWAKEFRSQEPHQFEELKRLASLFRDIGEVDEAVQSFRMAAELTPDESLAARTFRQSASLLDEDGRLLDARSDFEALAELDSGDGDAVSSLQTIYREQEEWRALVGLNERYLSQVQVVPARIELLLENKRVQEERLGEKDNAFIVACRVLSEYPDDEQALQEVERLARATDNLEGAASVIEDEVERAADIIAQARLLEAAARIYDEDVEDYSSSEEKLQELLTLEPANADALNRLVSVAQKDERYDKAISALERKYDIVTTDEARKGILFESARIWQEKVGDSDEAIAVYTRILELDGTDRGALDSLAALYEEEEGYAELTQVLTRIVQLSADMEEQVSLRLKVARICEGKLGDPDSAIEWYRGVVDIDGAQEDALEALERLYTNLDRWSELIQVFERRIPNAAHSGEAIGLLTKIAAIYEEEFESPADAVQVYERGLELEPGNQMVARSLQRVLRTTRNYERLIEVLSHEAAIASHKDDVTEIYLQMGEVYYRDLAQVDQAEKVYKQAQSLNPSSVDALAALGKLYERSGNFFDARETLRQQADLLGSQDEALPVLARIGRINDEMLGDTAAAKEAYEGALEIDAYFEPALEALREIAKNSHDWDRYSELLLMQADHTEDGDEKTELFTEAARFYRDVREDKERAQAFYERALDVDADNLDAQRDLGDLYFETENWEDASRIYKDVVDRLDKSEDAVEYCQRHYRLGYIEEKGGDSFRALYHYQEAHEASPSYLPALEGLAQALFASESWPEAHKTIQTILVQHRDALAESEVIDLQVQLGEIAIRLGETDKAYRQFEKALETDPDHPVALKQLAELDEESEHWNRAYERWGRYIRVAPDDERSAALIRMSDIASVQLGDSSKAIDALERARKFALADDKALERLAEAYQDNHQTNQAVEVLLEASDFAESPKRRASLLVRLAQIYHYDIRHEPMAVKRYNEALDEDPLAVEAFEAIESLLAARKEWGLLEENYRRMIARAQSQSDAFRQILWRGLAELYRQVLKSPSQAARAYEAMRDLGDFSEGDKRNLAELYGQLPEKREQAIQFYRDLVIDADNPVQHIKELRRLYHADENFDAVYLCAAALDFMGAADDEEKQIFEYLGRGVPSQAAGSLAEMDWAKVRHPGVEGPLAAFCAELFKVGHDVILSAPKDLGLKKKDRIDVISSDLLVGKLTSYCNATLGQSIGDIYVKPQSLEGVRFAAVLPPALRVGSNHELFRNPSHTMAARFTLGRYVASARPELILGRIFPGAALRNVLLGACALFKEDLVNQGHPKTVQAWRDRFMGLPKEAHERLLSRVPGAVEELLRDGGIQSYMEGVEHTLNRAAMVVCGSYVAAHRSMQAEDDAVIAISLRARTKDLVKWSLSEDYLEVRKTIGAALVAKA